jgi:hypothetical protein
MGRRVISALDEWVGPRFRLVIRDRVADRALLSERQRQFIDLIKTDNLEFPWLVRS